MLELVALLQKDMAHTFARDGLTEARARLLWVLQDGSAVTLDRDLPSSIRTFQPLATDRGVDLQIGVSARANVHLTLTEPMTVTVKG